MQTEDQLVGVATDAQKDFAVKEFRFSAAEDAAIKTSRLSARVVEKETLLATKADADIEVDGVFYGNAGGQMKRPEGLHLVKISLPGYEVWDKKVRIAEGTRIKAMLVEETQADVRLEIEKKRGDR